MCWKIHTHSSIKCFVTVTEGQINIQHKDENTLKVRYYLGSYNFIETSSQKAVEYLLLIGHEIFTTVKSSIFSQHFSWVKQPPEYNPLRKNNEKLQKPSQDKNPIFSIMTLEIVCSKAIGKT